MTDTLDAHPSTEIVRALNLGESGGGKTGALASLVIAGYTLWILDYDNGLDILVAALREHYKSDPDGLKAAMSRVHYKTLRDATVVQAGVVKIKAPPTAWKDSGKALQAWNINSFTNNDVIVIDTLSTMTRVALNEAMMLGARLNQKVADIDYGWMATSVFLFIEMLTDDDLKCNLVVNSHIRYLHGQEETVEDSRGNEKAAGAIKGLPNALGQQIPREIAKYFNTLITTRVGPGGKRTISTTPNAGIDVKTANPFGVKKSYPVETGLADLFRDMLGHGPTPTQPTPKEA